MAHDDKQTQHQTAGTEERSVMLAQEAVARGWTRQQVVRALRARIRRDEHYLAYRQLKGHHTPIDEAIQADLYPLALAARYLAEDSERARQDASRARLGEGR